MHNLGRRLVAFVTGLLLLTGAVGLYLHHAPAPPPLEHGAYVWQYVWTPAVDAALARSEGRFAAYYVFCAEVTVDGDQLAARRAAPGWAALQRSGAKVWPVLRVRNTVTPCIAVAPEVVAEYLARITRGFAAQAAGNGLTLAGVQIDYDCPTESLPAYALLTDALHRTLPDIPISITALPTWLGQDALAEVLAHVAHYTLQVHGLDKPNDMDDSVTLCDTTRIPGWLARADTLGRPFNLALPTYTYRLYFTPIATFAALGAEGAPAAPQGYIMKDAGAEPEELAAVVRALEDAPPRLYRGIHWFRLPVDGDQLNWTWPTLDAVMNGHAPEVVLLADVRTPRAGLYEVWLRNAGEYTPRTEVRVRVQWSGCDVAADDALGDFQLIAHEAAHAVLTGPAPSPGEERMAAWFRMACDTAILEARNVEIIK